MRNITPCAAHDRLVEIVDRDSGPRAASRGAQTSYPMLLRVEPVAVSAAGRPRSQSPDKRISTEPSACSASSPGCAERCSSRDGRAAQAKARAKGPEEGDTQVRARLEVGPRPLSVPARSESPRPKGRRASARSWSSTIPSWPRAMTRPTTGRPPRRNCLFLRSSRAGSARSRTSIGISSRRKRARRFVRGLGEPSRKQDPRLADPRRPVLVVHEPRDARWPPPIIAISLILA